MHRLQRKQYAGAVDHVTLPWRRSERELEHHGPLRSTPVDARPAGAAAIENETWTQNLSGHSPSLHHRPNAGSSFSYTMRRNDVGNQRTSVGSKTNYR